MVELVGALNGLTEAVDNLRAYLERVAACAVRWTVAVQSSPVRVPRDSRTVMPAAMAAYRGREAVDPEQPETQQPGPDVALADQEWSAAVRRRVLGLLVDDAPAERAAMERVLLGEERAESAAAATGLPVQRVWVITQRTKRRILADAQLRARWREIATEEE